jgi:uncharacterized phiE125 gp8 family phage protein
MNDTTNVITPTWAMGLLTFLEEAETEPVTEGELRQHLRVEENIETDYLMRLARTGRHVIERMTNRSWAEQVISIECSVARPILPLPLSAPLQKFENVQWIDSDGIRHEVDPNLYLVDYGTIPISIDLTAAPAANRYLVVYRAGDKAGPLPPDDIRHAILIMARWAYQHPDGMMPDTKYKTSGGNVPLMVGTLCDPYTYETKGW